MCPCVADPEQWMDPKYAPEVLFLQLLARCRSAASSYLIHGRLMPAPTLAPGPTSFTAPPGTSIHNPGPFPVVSTTAWRSDAQQAVLFLLAGVTSSNFTTTLTANLADYGNLNLIVMLNTRLSACFL